MVPVVIVVSVDVESEAWCMVHVALMGRWVYRWWWGSGEKFWCSQLAMSMHWDQSLLTSG